MTALAVAILLAGLLAGLAGRLGAAAVRAGIMLATALLLPGIALALAPNLVAAFWPAGMRPVAPGGLGSWLLEWRLLGALPLLLLPVLGVLARMPPGQARAAAGLGAGAAARLRLLWLPQLGPACLLGLTLAATLAVVAEALLSSPSGWP